MSDRPPVKDPSALSEDAWGMISQALHSGTLILGDGSARVLAPGDLVRLVQWLATVKAKKPRAFANVDDFAPKATKKGAEK